ncbi:MAG TPA: hypothetical protein PLF96_06180 [Thermotogota bacterium]|nr:hypothetical protein [Thermotogota bacterium]
MKKTILVLLLLCLMALSAFALRLGVQLNNWAGYIQGMYVRGTQILQVQVGSPAWGSLQPGDIITEAVMVPNSQVWMNPGMPGQGFVLNFNPYVPLSSQISMLNQYGVGSYMATTNWMNMVNLINAAPYGSNVILRIFRPSWNSYTLASIILDNAGNGSIWLMPQPVPMSGQVQVVPQPGGGQVQVQAQPTGQFNLQIWFHF